MKLLATLALALLAWAAPGQATAQPACQAGTLSALRACIAQAQPGTRIALTQDIACATAEECCPGAATLRLTGLGPLSIDGQGHTLRRTAAQRTCPAVLIRNAPELALSNLTFDEDRTAPPCELADKPCAYTLDISTTRGLTLDGLRVHWGKGVAVHIWHSADIMIRRTEIADSGIIALYAGHHRYGVTTNILVESSRILRTRANGIAFLGADNAVVRTTRFEGNHWHGLWPNAVGGISPGGQLLLAQGNGMRVEDNVFVSANCGNCTPSQMVTALEIGEGPDSPGVTDLTITGNRICHATHGWAIYHNPGAPPGTATVANNRISGYTGIDNLRGPVTRSNNAIARDTCSG